MIDVILTDIIHDGDEVSAKFKVFGKLSERFVVEDEEFAHDYFEAENNWYKQHEKYAWESDDSYVVVGAYLFDIGYLYDAFLEILYYAIDTTGLADGEYRVTADASEEVIVHNIKPIKGGKYDASDSDMDYKNIKVDNIKIKKI